MRFRIWPRWTLTLRRLRGRGAGVDANAVAVCGEYQRGEVGNGESVLAKGTMLKLYFGSDFDFTARSSKADGKEPKVSFGLPPTARALEAYLEMLEGGDLPWSPKYYA
jgi:hypothetical protein